MDAGVILLARDQGLEGADNFAGLHVVHLGEKRQIDFRGEHVPESNLSELHSFYVRNLMDMSRM